MTANRNDDGPDSLEAVIRDRESAGQPAGRHNLETPGRVLKDRLYAERVAERLLEYLMRIDEVRGAGRLYVP